MEKFKFLVLFCIFCAAVGENKVSSPSESNGVAENKSNLANRGEQSLPAESVVDAHDHLNVEGSNHHNQNTSEIVFPPQPTAKPGPKPKPTTPSPTTPKPTTPSPTTPKPTTPSPTTPKPTTPSPTTPKPPPPSPTTPKPSPPTTIKPPTPTPSKGIWYAKTTSNITYIVLQIATQIHVDYKDGNVSKSDIYNIPENATSSGNYDGDMQSIALNWGPAEDSIVFHFAKVVNTTTFDVENIELNLNLTFPNNNASIVQFQHHENREFVTPLKKSYKCDHEQILHLNITSNSSVTSKFNVTAFLVVSDVRIEAFRNVTNHDFSEALDCISQTPDIVPIAVGIALAVLVMIVLVGYLIGRRRSQARGYLSM